MLSPNTILQNRYRVVRELGRGGMGTVYEAIDQRVNCLVALKETVSTSNSETRAAFEREAALLANLRHQSLPKVMDFFSENEGDFLVMEFIPGHDLAALLELRGSSFPQEQVLRWAFELLQLLEYLHEQTPPILHRDIKPSNLKLTNKGEIFLLDFGLAKGSAGQMPTLATSRSVRGYTPVYASLEQIHGHGTDERSDLYSAGATLYHLLAGVPPIDAPSRYQVIEDDRPDPLRSITSLNPQCSTNVAQVIAQSMALSRKHRFVSAAAMSRALQDAARVDGPRSVASEHVQTEPRQPATIKDDRVSRAVQHLTEKARDPAEAKTQEESKHSVEQTVTAVPMKIDQQLVSGGSQTDSANTTTKVANPSGKRRGLPVLFAVAGVLVLAVLVIGAVTTYYVSRSALKAANSTSSPPNAPANLQSFEFQTLTLDRNGNVLSREKKNGYSYSENLGNDVKLEMVAIPQGEFMMGSPDSETGRDKDESPQRRVRINYGFYMGKFEVTQAQWRAVIGTNPSHSSNCDDCPVEQVSWTDAQEFCQKLSARAGMKYRLPSESEWEYAARAGTTTPFAFGEALNADLANYDSNRKKTIPVGSLSIANAFGLYDMHGNVYEWCEDSYVSIFAGNSLNDGSAFVSENPNYERVIRGGSWRDFVQFARSANRSSNPPSTRYLSLGFRIVGIR